MDLCRLLRQSHAAQEAQYNTAHHDGPQATIVIFGQHEATPRVEQRHQSWRDVVGRNSVEPLEAQVREFIGLAEPGLQGQVVGARQPTRRGFVHFPKFLPHVIVRKLYWRGGRLSWGAQGPSRVSFARGPHTVEC